MKNRKYILKNKDVGFLASAIAIQEGQISLHKDSESSFYIATVQGDDIHIPESLKMLEMNTIETQDEPVAENLLALPTAPEANSTDIVLRLHLNQNIAPEKFPMLYEEIAKAVDSAMKKMDD